MSFAILWIICYLESGQMNNIISVSKILTLKIFTNELTLCNSKGIAV